LKCKKKGLTQKNLAVAPHVGAWIEIYSHAVNHRLTYVAPHVGAWIEIHSPFLTFTTVIVAPHVGAWIEITVSLANNSILGSLLT